MIRKGKNKTFHTAEVVFLIIITCTVGLGMGFAIGSKQEEQTNNIDNKYYEKFIENYNYIKENYYEDIDDEKIMNGAIKGMIESLDDQFSLYMDDEDSEDFNQRIDGNYSGVGIEITNDKDNNIFVTRVFKNSPAEKSGIKPLDIVKSVDEKDLTGKDKSELTNYIKNSKKNNFEIVVIRENKEVKIALSKDNVVIPSVYSKTTLKNDKKIGHIYMEVFSNTTYNQFEEQLKELEKDGINGLIIDVRDNSGGSLATTANILSLFIDKKKIIYQTEFKNKKTPFYSTGSKTKEYPIIVLQNKNSASASELLSISLKESYGATIIGETSYGKGTVQEMVTLNNGSEYKFTTKKWLSPNGNWINKVGIKPDIEVKLNEDYYNNPSEEIDNQLQEAINYLLK